MDRPRQQTAGTGHLQLQVAEEIADGGSAVDPHHVPIDDHEVERVEIAGQRLECLSPAGPGCPELSAERRIEKRRAREPIDGHARDPEP